MAEKKKVTLNLDKERTLHFDLNSLIELEEKMGVSLSEIGSVKMSIKNIRSFLFAGLMHEDPELTEQKLGKLISLDNLSEVKDKLSEAFRKENPKN